MPVCAYEHCDAPVAGSRVKRGGKYCCNAHRWKQHNLETSRAKVDGAGRDVLAAAMAWFEAGERHGDDHDYLDRLYGACARYASEKKEPEA